MPSVNGRIDRAYIALSQDGPAVDVFSAENAPDWVFLTLEYSYSVAEGPQELTFEVVEYFEDGFVIRRRDVPAKFEPQYIGGTRWASVGPSPPQNWAPGRYWAYVYEGDRKVAEVEFVVTQ